MTQNVAIMRRKRPSVGTHPVRARPKSQILRSQLASSSRLDGFRSRCSTLALWTYFSPRSSCAGQGG